MTKKYNPLCLKCDKKFPCVDHKVTKKSLDKIREEKFCTNTFAVDWNKDLKEKIAKDKQKRYEATDKYFDILENAEQVKSWNRYDRELSTKEVVAIVLASVFLGVIASMVITTPVILEMCK